MQTHVIYHKSCLDGLAAAFAAKIAHPDAVFHAASYGDSVPEIPDGSAVYIVDFSYKRDVLMELAKRCNVIVLDHHKTAQADLEGLPQVYRAGGYKVMIEGPTPEGTPFVHFDMEKSGAVLAWEYFGGDILLPYIYQLVQDGDLWKWEFGDDTRAFRAFMQVQELTLERFSEIFYGTRDEDDMVALLESGMLLLDAQRQNVEIFCKNAFWSTVDHEDCIMVNAPLLQSEVGHELLQKYPEAKFAAVFTVKDGSWKFSLRSRGDFDVAALAGLFGGGGHKAAAGFELEADNPAVWLGNDGLRVVGRE